MVGNLGLGFRSKVIQKNAGSLRKDNSADLLIQTGKFLKYVVYSFVRTSCNIEDRVCVRGTFFNVSLAFCSLNPKVATKLLVKSSLWTMFRCRFSCRRVRDDK